MTTTLKLNELQRKTAKINAGETELPLLILLEVFSKAASINKLFLVWENKCFNNPKFKSSLKTSIEFSLWNSLITSS